MVISSYRLLLACLPYLHLVSIKYNVIILLCTLCIQWTSWLHFTLMVRPRQVYPSVRGFNNNRENILNSTNIHCEATKYNICNCPSCKALRTQELKNYFTRNSFCRHSMGVQVVLKMSIKDLIVFQLKNYHIFTFKHQNYIKLNKIKTSVNLQMIWHSIWILPCQELDTDIKFNSDPGFKLNRWLF